jgi:hypothetical protein
VPCSCDQIKKIISRPCGLNSQQAIRDGVKYYIITMARKARIDYSGLAHHVIVRTFNGLVLFKDGLIQQAAVSHAARKAASLAEKFSIIIGGEDSIVE